MLAMKVYLCTYLSPYRFSEKKRSLIVSDLHFDCQPYNHATPPQEYLEGRGEREERGSGARG